MTGRPRVSNRSGATGGPAPGGRSADLNLSIDAERLWDDIMALGAITEPDRPYTRRSFSPVFDEGRAWLTQRMQEAGLATHIDAAGNLIGRRDGKDPPSPAIVVGSHSDSVPAGGRFDGMAGVVGGIAIARTLAEHGHFLRHRLEIIDFLAEEPNEFGLSCIGSRGLSGCLTAEHLALRNPRNETLAGALARVGGAPAQLGSARRSDIQAAFELHIEQGPVLEAEGIDIGLVTAIVGITRLEIEFQGAAGHAGTTPMKGRRDPLLAAARLVGWVRACAEELAARGRGHFVATVGVIEALPGATNVIPGSARILIDARSEDRRLMEEFRGALEAESRAAAQKPRMSSAASSSASPITCRRPAIPTCARCWAVARPCCGYPAWPWRAGQAMTWRSSRRSRPPPWSSFRARTAAATRRKNGPAPKRWRQAPK